MKVKTSSKFLLHGLFLLPLFSFCQHITGDSEEAIHIAFVGSSSGESATDSKAIVRGINLYGIPAITPLSTEVDVTMGISGISGPSLMMTFRTFPGELYTLCF